MEGETWPGPVGTARAAWPHSTQAGVFPRTSFPPPTEEPHLGLLRGGSPQPPQRWTRLPHLLQLHPHGLPQDQEKNQAWAGIPFLRHCEVRSERPVGIADTVGSTGEAGPPKR